MAGDDDVLTLDSISNNPNFDFLTHYSSSVPIEDEQINTISP